MGTFMSYQHPELGFKTGGNIEQISEGNNFASHGGSHYPLGLTLLERD